MVLPSALVAALVLQLASASSIPPDPFAHPRFALQFLNDLPISASHASALLDRQAQSGPSFVGGTLAGPEGKEGDVGWFYAASKGSQEPLLARQMESIGEGSDRSSFSDPTSSKGNYTLQRFVLPPSRSYLCLLPPSSSPSPPPPSPPAPSLDPSLPAQLLKHLEGTCLYTKAGWFTYAYCHGDSVRQFKEQQRTWPPKAGWVPKVDDRYEDYILGVRLSLLLSFSLLQHSLADHSNSLLFSSA